ncbi:MAG: DUF4097 family beta strand repeat-containing protein [Myxococcota bacterium]
MRLQPIAIPSLLALAACDFDEVRVDLAPESLQASFADTLRVDVDAGRLDVLGSAKSAVVVTPSVFHARHHDERDVLDALEIRFEPVGNEIRLDVRFSDSFFPEPYVDLLVEVPERFALDVVDGSGDLEISGVGSVRLQDDSGHALVREVLGDLVVVDDSGDFSAEDIGGDVRINDDSGEIRLFRVGGAVEIDDGSGDMELRDVAGRVLIRDDSGTIRIERAPGRVEIFDGSGDIDLIDAPNAEVLSNDSGTVRRR